MRIASALAAMAWMGTSTSGPAAAQEATLDRVLSTIGSAIDVSQPERSSDANDSAANESPDKMRDLQTVAMQMQRASWGHWGNNPGKFSTWTNHSNRLVPLYAFGMDLSDLRERGSLYSDADRLEKAFGQVPSGTLNTTAHYHDQIDVYDLQRWAADQGKRHIIVMIFDGMDWQTTRAAAIYRNQADLYDSGRGRGLAFQDYHRVPTDFAFIATTPRLGGAKPDVDAQTITGGGRDASGGFDPELAGPMPWHEQPRRGYPIGIDRERPHSVTDSASSASSLFSGIKTYNGSINVNTDGSQVVPIARDLQQEGFRIGVVSSVPVSHATPAAAYANNVSRKDYQDIARDLIGLPSSAHRDQALPGVDVLIGGGHGEGAGKESTQGANFMPGNPYLHQSDLKAVDVEASTDSKGNRDDRRYVIAQRTADRAGGAVLAEAAQRAINTGHRLLGFFGVRGGHLPFQTADGQFDPTFDVKGTERYTPDDIAENPSLAEMTSAALKVLSAPKADTDNGETEIPKFWLTVEAGDVDWANHANNLDNSIGAVFSGEAAFEQIARWAEEHDAWDDTVVLVTSDHGHFFVIDDAEAIAESAR